MTGSQHESYGVYYFISSGTMVNNVIVGGSGGGSYGIIVFNIKSKGAITLVNNSIWGNGLNCLVAEACGSIAAVNECGWPGCQEAYGNITGNPLLHNPEDGDYHLNGTSPCIDAGVDPNPWYTGTEPLWDFEGDPRPLDGDGNGSTEWDMGVDEYLP